MTEENWEIIERMLDKITADCLGENLYNGLKTYLNGATLTIQFKKVGEIGGNFGTDKNGNIGIILDQKMESNQLLHEMMHAYRAYNETASSYNLSKLNGEIEAYYAQYLYTQRLPEYSGSEWERMYNLKGERSKAVKKLETALDHKGNLRNSNSRSLLAKTLNDLIIVLRKNKIYNDSAYIYDYSRDLLSNFSNLRTLAVDC